MGILLWTSGNFREQSLLCNVWFLTLKTLQNLVAGQIGILKCSASSAEQAWEIKGNPCSLNLAKLLVVTCYLTHGNEIQNVEVLWLAVVSCCSFFLFVCSVTWTASVHTGFGSTGRKDSCLVWSLDIKVHILTLMWAPSGSCNWYSVILLR